MTADWSDWPGLEEARRRSGLDSAGDPVGGWNSGACISVSSASSASSDDGRRWVPGTMLPEYQPAGEPRWCPAPAAVGGDGPCPYVTPCAPGQCHIKALES